MLRGANIAYFLEMETATDRMHRLLPPITYCHIAVSNYVQAFLARPSQAPITLEQNIITTLKELILDT